MQKIEIRILSLMSILICLTFSNIKAQDADLKKYDVFTDTLLIINGKTIDCERILMTRQEVLESDTIRINQKGLKLASFTMTALTLGHSIELSSNYALLTQAMRNEIINKETNFKFIYIKDINLQAKDGRNIVPSLNVIKIIFSN